MQRPKGWRILSHLGHWVERLTSLERQADRLCTSLLFSSMNRRSRSGSASLAGWPGAEGAPMAAQPCVRPGANIIQCEYTVHTPATHAETLRRNISLTYPRTYPKITYITPLTPSNNPKASGGGCKAADRRARERRLPPCPQQNAQGARRGTAKGRHAAI